MSGMADESYDEEVDLKDPRGFMAQPFLNKVFIICAGVIMNIILGFLIYTAIIWSSGIGKTTGTTLSYVSENYPAAEIGLMEGDRIAEVGGKRVESWEDLTNKIREYPGIPVSIYWYRSDSLMRAEITPRATPEFNVSEVKMDTVGKIGILGTIEVEKVGIFTASYYGAEQVWSIIRLNAVSFGALLTGRAQVKELTGPLGIAKMSGDSARSGVATFFSFIGLISISIAFLNILPIPMLDGGHLLFVVIEAIIGREIPEKIKVNLLKVGFAAIILLFLVVSYHDVIRYYIGTN